MALTPAFARAGGTGGHSSFGISPPHTSSPGASTRCARRARAASASPVAALTTAEQQQLNGLLRKLMLSFEHGARDGR